jgi:hypothetical protein
MMVWRGTVGVRWKILGIIIAPARPQAQHPASAYQGTITSHSHGRRSKRGGIIIVRGYCLDFLTTQVSHRNLDGVSSRVMMIAANVVMIVRPS